MTRKFRPAFDGKLLKNNLIFRKQVVLMYEFSNGSFQADDASLLHYVFSGLIATLVSGTNVLGPD